MNTVAPVAERSETASNAKPSFELRLESIGGLGAHAAGQVLATAAVLRMGFNGAHFSSYGSEKKGSRVLSFVRLGPADDGAAPVDPQQRRTPARDAARTEQSNSDPGSERQHLDVGGRSAPQQALGGAHERHRHGRDDLFGQVAGDAAQIRMDFRAGTAGGCSGRHPISIT